VGILLFLCRLGARRQIGHLLRTPAAARTFATVFTVESVPHGDTLNNVLCPLEPHELQEVVSAMVEALIRKKKLDAFRLLGKYHLIAVDGTVALTFDHPHCVHCLSRTQNGKTTYFHPVLEAKLVTPNGFAFSIMSEFIENPEGEYSKQDCELKAFYRLVDRLKLRFPRLPIALALDGLFAGGPVFERCHRYGWRFLIGLKDKDLSSVNEEFQALCTLEPGNHLRVHTGKKGLTEQHLRWANNISYVDTRKMTHELAVLECRQTQPGKRGSVKETTFRWVTNFTITRDNAMALTNQGGRLRWKIENEGFNIQKTGGYQLEHAYTHDPNAIRCYYYLLQMACIISQLMEKGSLLKAAFPKGFGSVKNMAYRILEDWRTKALLDRLLQDCEQSRFQIRFDSS